MKDIKLSELDNIDYIPEDGYLCEKCVFFDECPLEYLCPSLVRVMNYEAENGEL